MRDLLRQASKSGQIQWLNLSSGENLIIKVYDKSGVQPMDILIGILFVCINAWSHQKLECYLNLMVFRQEGL